MNKTAATQIATLVRAGLPRVLAAQLVKAAADSKAIQARMEKEAWNPLTGIKNTWGMLFGRGAARGAGAGGAAARIRPSVPAPTPRSPSLGEPPVGKPHPPADSFSFEGVPRPTPPGVPGSPGAPGGIPGSEPAARGWKRPLIGLGALGAAGITGQHMQNAAQNTYGLSMNPFTWRRGALPKALGLGDEGPSRERIFQRNQEGFNTAAQGIRAEMDAAMSAGDTEKLKALNAKFQSGDFEHNPSPDPLAGKFGKPFGDWRMFGLNPWATERGDYYQKNMQEQQGAMQGSYDTELGKSGPKPGDPELVKHLEDRLKGGDLLPGHAQAMQQQLDAVKRRMGQQPGTVTPEAEAIRRKMEDAGMRWRAPGGQRASTPTGTPSPMAPYGNWNFTGAGHGLSQGFYMNPYDSRSRPQEPDYLPQFGNRQPM